MDGKNIRLNRILQNGKMLCVPLDHGITNGPIANLTRFRNLVSDVISSGATAVIAHKGMIRYLPNLQQTGLILHLSASTEFQDEVNKILICDVLEALQYGADAVSIHINIGNRFEQTMLKDLSVISAQCNHYGMPLLTMIYVRDDDNKNITEAKKLSHAVRIAAEIGSDIVKISLPDDMKSLKNIIDLSPIPIVFAGGERYSDDLQLLDTTKLIMSFDALGISFGRNIFKSPTPAHTVAALRKIVIDG